MFDRLQMRAALLAEARAAAYRMAPDPSFREWSVNENAGTVSDVHTGEIIVYLDPMVITPEWERFAARAFA